MTNMSIFAGVQALRADGFVEVLQKQGRSYASDSEAWAVIKRELELIEQAAKQTKDLHKEMWTAIKDGDPDAFAALCGTMENTAASLAGEWIRVSAMAKIAVEDPELPEPEMEEDE